MRTQTVLALALFAGLLAAALLLGRRPPERGISRLNLASVDRDAVDRIEVAGPEPIKLLRKDGRWQVEGGREADAEMVSGMLGNLGRIQSSDMIASDPARFAGFEVEGEKAHAVKFWARGRLVADIVVGAATGSGTAVRQGKEVYRVAGLFPGAFAHPAGQWRERRLLREKPEDVARIHVALVGQQPYTLVQKDAGWELVDAPATNFRFDPQAAATLASNLLNTRAQELVADDVAVDTTHLDDGRADKFTLFLKDGVGGASGVTRVLRLGAARDDTTLYAKAEGADELALLPTYAGNSLRKRQGDMRNLALSASATLADVAAIAIRGNKETFRIVKKDGAWALAPKTRAPAGFTLDPVAVDRRVHDVLNARAVGIADDQPAALRTIKASRRDAVLELNDGRKLAMVFGGPASEQPRTNYTSGSADGLAYIVADFLRDTIIGPLDGLKKSAAPGGNDPLAGLDPSSLANLPPDVRASLQKQIADKRRQGQAMQAVGH